MDARGYAIATPEPPDASLPTEPALDLKSGYVLRSLHALPRQGVSAPWKLHENYVRDVRLLKRGPVDDAMRFSRRERHSAHAREAIVPRVPKAIAEADGEPPTTRDRVEV
jgi:monooxygenase